MFGKKYRFLLEKDNNPEIKLFWIRDWNKKLIAHLMESLSEYIPELTKIQPGEWAEIEIRIKGRK